MWKAPPLDRLVGVTWDLAGTLVAPTGRIVACDPLVFLDRAKAFSDPIPPGRYPVHVGRRQRDVDVARLLVHDRPIVRLVPALCAGEQLDDGVPGYPVDAGTGCFVDQATAEASVERRPDLLQRLRDAGYGDRPSAEVALEPATSGNLIAFRSGDGDGAYTCWWGLDAEGDRVALLTDFGIFDADEVDETDPEDAPESDVDLPAITSAQRLLDALVEAEALLLTEGADRAALARDMAPIVESRRTPAAKAEKLAELLLNDPRIDDFFADDEELARVLTDW